MGAVLWLRSNGGAQWRSESFCLFASAVLLSMFAYFCIHELILHTVVYRELVVMMTGSHALPCERLASG